MSEDSEQNNDWTNPQYCPYCGSENLEDRDKDWNQRNYPKESDEGMELYRFHGVNVCKDCGGKFETVSEPRQYEKLHRTFTLQFVPQDTEEEETQDMQAIKLIEDSEDSPSVRIERAKWNMMFGGCGEVQGPEHAIRDLYSFLTIHSNIESDEEVFTSGKWLLK